MTFSRRGIFGLIGGVAAVAGLGGLFSKAQASVPYPLQRIAELRAARAAAPATRLGNTATRGVNGLCREYHAAIYGDGVHDDGPGFTEILNDKWRASRNGRNVNLPSVELPADRVYRLNNPLNVRGDIEFINPGKGRVCVRADDNKLSRPLANGHARFFWVEGSLELSDGNFKVVDLPA